LSLPRLRRIKDALGVTLNDLVLTTVCGAVGRYHDHRGVHVDELRCMVPINLRQEQERDALGNRVGMCNIGLPVGEADPLMRLEIIRKQTTTAKVDRRGVAYVLFSSGTLFRVSTRTGACETTPLVPGAGGFPTVFGMGYASDSTGNGETLYVAGNPMDPAGNPLPSILGTLDTTAYAVTPIAAFSPPTGQPELTGTGAGKLFGFYATTPSDSAISGIDVTSAQLTSTVGLPGVAQGGAWAFGFWGGDFYVFTAPDGPATSSVVTRYRPADGSITEIAMTPGLTIVGAGVSTCAPQM